MATESSRHPAPDYRLVLDGRDITPAFNARLESLTLTDNRGFEADTLDISLDDSDGKLAIPDRGVTIALFLGWRGEPLVDKGTFIVDEVEHSGTPDRLTLRAKSADLRAGLITKQTKSWAGHKIGEIVKTIAAAHGLTPKVSKGLASLSIEHIDQTNESDVNLLTRLARDHDAIATVKKGMLLFMPIGEAETVSGTPFPTVTITRASGDQHRFAMAERDTYTAVKAYYQDIRGGTHGEVLVNAKGSTATGGKRKNKSANTEIKASAENTKVLRHTYASKTTAERAAKAEWQRLQRGVASFSLNLARGRADLFPELPVIVQGFKPEIDATDWLIARATHSLSSSGFTTALEMEIKTSRAED